MLGIHVRLNLENESREFRISRLHNSDGRIARKRCRSKLKELLEERLQPEVRKRASEKHRRQLTCEQLCMIERMPRLIEQRDVMHQSLVRIGTEKVLQLLALQRPDLHLGTRCSVLLVTRKKVN